MCGIIVSHDFIFSLSYHQFFACTITQRSALAIRSTKTKNRKKNNNEDITPTTTNKSVYSIVWNGMPFSLNHLLFCWVSKSHRSFTAVLYFILCVCHLIYTLLHAENYNLKRCDVSAHFRAQIWCMNQVLWHNKIVLKMILFQSPFDIKCITEHAVT